MSKIQIFALLISAAMAVVIFQLVRKKKLKEQYSLLWFLTAAVIFALALWESLLERVSQAIGIATPSNALFLLALLFLFGIALHFSLLLSRLTDQSKMLAQRLAMLDRDLRRLREEKGVRGEEAEAEPVAEAAAEQAAEPESAASEASLELEANEPA